MKYKKKNIGLHHQIAQKEFSFLPRQIFVQCICTKHLKQHKLCQNYVLHHDYEGIN